MKNREPREDLAYPAFFEPEPEGGFTVTFPEAGIAATYGANWQEALAQAEDMLEEAVLGMIAHGEDVPRPASLSTGDRLRPAVHLPAPTAAKLEIYRAMRDAGLGEEQLAVRLGWQPAQVTRLFDSRRPVRLDHVEAALRALGRRLVVTSEAA
jgi:antitoxin HicB